MLVHNKYDDNIEHINYVNERILLAKIRAGKYLIYFRSVYTLHTNKAKDKREKFYIDLQDVNDKIPKNVKLIILGDMNAQIGNTSL